MMTAELLPNSSESSFHVVVEKPLLLKALGHCQGVVERRNTVPILAHVLLEAQDTALKIMATDLEIALIETIPAHIKAKGSTTVSAHLLFDVVRKLPEGAEIELKMEAGGTSLQLRSGRSSYQFACLPAIEFPPMTTEELPCTFKIQTKEFSRLIDKTKFSMSSEETRYYLNGIYFHRTPDGFLRAVATDGLRLAQAQMTLPQDVSDLPSVIVSRKTIHEVRKLIDELDEEVTLALSEKQILFTVGSTLLISRLIEGKFPDYEKVIPLANDKVLNIDVKAFAEAVDRVSVMSTDKLRPIKMQIEGSTMTISSHSSEVGSAVEELEVTYEGSPVNFGFNARFILDVTQQISGPTLKFLIGDETQAVMAKDATDESTLYVLMPLRV